MSAGQPGTAAASRPDPEQKPTGNVQPVDGNRAATDAADVWAQEGGSPAGKIGATRPDDPKTPA